MALIYTSTITLMYSSIRRHVIEVVSGVGCFLAWLIFVVVIGHAPIVIDLLKQISFRTVFPSILLVYVVLVASNLYMISNLEKIKAALLLAVSVLWISALLIVSSMYPFKGEIILTDEVIYISAAVVTIVGIFITACLTYFPFREQVRRWRALSDRDAANAAVERQNLERTNPGKDQW